MCCLENSGPTLLWGASLLPDAQPAPAVLPEPRAARAASQRSWWRCCGPVWILWDPAPGCAPRAEISPLPSATHLVSTCREAGVLLLHLLAITDDPSTSLPYSCQLENHWLLKVKCILKRGCLDFCIFFFLLLFVVGFIYLFFIPLRTLNNLGGLGFVGFFFWSVHKGVFTRGSRKLALH